MEETNRFDVGEVSIDDELCAYTGVSTVAGLVRSIERRTPNEIYVTLAADVEWEVRIHQTEDVMQIRKTEGAFGGNWETVTELNIR